MKESCKSVSIYDKSNNLISYTEFVDYLDTPKCFYSVSANVLSRIHVNEDYAEKKPVYETVSSIIEYNDNVMLFPLVLDGETQINAICSGDTADFNNLPEIDNRFDTYYNNSDNTTDIEGFGVKSDLINEYINKL